MVNLHCIVPQQFNVLSKFNDLTFFLFVCLVELPLVRDWVVLVLEHAPVEVFGNAIMSRSVFLLGDYGAPANNAGVHDKSIYEIVLSPLGSPLPAHGGINHAMVSYAILPMNKYEMPFRKNVYD
eukprot:12678807-Ditylum_brightwellii.AAC.1